MPNLQVRPQAERGQSEAEKAHENRTRHKKCDESKPACTPCRTAGYRCEFTEVPQRKASTSYTQEISGVGAQSLHLQAAGLPSSLPNHMFFLTDFEAMYFDYFRLVCVRDFGLFFESSRWESILVQAACSERSLFHAALAASVQTRTNYSPEQDWHDPECAGSAIGYSMLQYNRAIKCLNTRLRSAADCAEIAVLSSILFITIEGFQGYRTQMLIHLRGGLSLVQNLKASSPNTPYLKNALYRMRDQVQMFSGYEEAVDR
jgi:hypothetical protein